MSTEPMSGPGFVDALVARVPSTRSIVDEHLDDQDGELLLHLLMADVSRFALSAFQRGDAATAGSVVAVVEAGLVTGDDALVNAVEVSFVEVIGPWDVEMQAFISTWPQALSAEARCQS
jgi:hypothetical protein